MEAGTREKQAVAQPLHALSSSLTVHLCMCVCACVCVHMCVCVCFSTRTARQDTLVLWAAPARSVQQVSLGPYQRHHVHESRMLMITLLCRRDVHVSLWCDCLYCVPCGNVLSSRCVALFSAICFSHSPAHIFWVSAQARARAIEKGRGGAMALAVANGRDAFKSGPSHTLCMHVLVCLSVS